MFFYQEQDRVQWEESIQAISSSSDWEALDGCLRSAASCIFDEQPRGYDMKPKRETIEVLVDALSKWSDEGCPDVDVALEIAEFVRGEGELVELDDLGYFLNRVVNMPNLKLSAGAATSLSMVSDRLRAE